MNITDAVLTLICFITLARVDSSLVSSLVVSSSSTTTTSSPCLWRIQIAWGQDSSRSISSTLSSSAVARGTTGGLCGRTAGLTTPYDASGGTVCSLGTTLDSGTVLVSPAFAAEDSVVSTVASGIVADPFTIGANCSPLLSPPAAAVNSSIGS